MLVALVSLGPISAAFETLVVSGLPMPSTESFLSALNGLDQAVLDRGRHGSTLGHGVCESHKGAGVDRVQLGL